METYEGDFINKLQSLPLPPPPPFSAMSNLTSLAEMIQRCGVDGGGDNNNSELNKLGTEIQSTKL